MTDRQQLRQQVYRACLQYVTGQGLVALCSWCLETLGDEMDLHEYLVKRSAVPPDKQHLIMTPENLAPLHPACHMAHGQDREMTARCLHHVGRLRGLRSIGEWYVALWREHGLSVPKGILIAPGRERIWQTRNYYERGRQHHMDIRDDVDELQVGCALQAWRKRPALQPENGCRTPLERMVRAVDDGYWLVYLGGIISAADL